MAALKDRRFIPEISLDRSAVHQNLLQEDIEELKKKKILFVAGGVGAAPVYPQVKWMHEHGIDADVIVGAKTIRYADS